jgi:hypothetical protein
MFDTLSIDERQQMRERKSGLHHDAIACSCKGALACGGVADMHWEGTLLDIPGRWKFLICRCVIGRSESGRLVEIFVAAEPWCRSAESRLKSKLFE